MPTQRLNAKKLLIAAGGTGGHVFPALAVAAQFRVQGHEVLWLGTKRGIESRVVPENHIPITYIKVSALRGKQWHRWVMAPVQLLRALVQSIAIIKKHQPDALLVMGGFVSGPAGIAAWLCRKPLLVHEQNSVAGLTNRILSRFAKRVMISFSKTFPASKKIIETGNPLREDFFKIESPDIRFRDRDQTLRVLVLGGSQGALVLNQVVPKALTMLSNKLSVQVWHQTGQFSYEDTHAYYANSSIDIRCTPFINDVATAYAWADIVVCRAGALTIAELSAVGVGSILVPYPYAVDDHQTKNGLKLEAAKAAILLPQQLLTPERLYTLLLNLGHEREQLVKMASAAYQCRHCHATTQVTEQCMEVCGV